MEGDLSVDGGAFVFVGVIDAGYPVVRPRLFFGFCFGEGVFPQGVVVFAGVAIDQKWADDFGPIFALGGGADGAAVMAAAPIV